ncbi:pentatricopeptide repeat-containing protein At1g08070, chloroplastic-like [Punica granatum]|uniref:DYW domain-containing protein n=2 Tax=Punica granatum TaxID=22663 RepID=A0A218WGB0_PUNGR|nr:pentatricopeptide repeat-containing protein At1g08070, chloroplastic-like [Punica granatum]OWM71726.1 hypothetical protein CDL15_Pgr005914 [Punica granatum]PKI75720.1 hypothetical protein CRG98_003863 [Punica granatum]
MLSSPTIAIAPAPLHVLPSTDPPYKLLQSHPSLALLSKCRSTRTLKQIHSQIIKTGLHNTQFALSKLIEFCSISPCSDLAYAVLLFESIEQPNHLIWNTVIRGHSLSDSPALAIDFFVRMIVSGAVPNCYTFPFVLKSCARSGLAPEGRQVHAHILKRGLDSDVFVHSSLISMYAQNGDLEGARLVFDKSSHRDTVSFTTLMTGYALKGYMDDAKKLFDDMPRRDIVSWNAMIAGFTQCGKFDEALETFRKMQRKNVLPNESTIVTVLVACAQSGHIELGKWVHSWIKDQGMGSNLRIVNSLIDMYSKNGDLEKARSMFDAIQEKDVISWNVMIGGYNHMNHHREALELFREMLLQSHVKPNDVTFLNVLPSCACLCALDLGKWIHVYVDKNYKNCTSTSLSTSLMDMYAKCGNIVAAEQVFRSMEHKSLASWNAILSGSAMHGEVERALELFDEMLNEGFEPDEITFVGVLSACSHAGLVEFGRKNFTLMVDEFKITPQLHHYGCMINLLGRAGLFSEAESMIRSMDMEPDEAIWGSLLKACRIHRQVQLGETVAQNLFKLEPSNPGAYILLSNIYAEAGRWDDVARIRTRLNDVGMKKVPGCTSIEVNSVVHEFLVADKAHPQSEQIYKMLAEIDGLLERAGFEPDTTEVLYDIDEEWKEGALSQHSERIAIAFGLISTKPGTTIRIAKNLRVCRNCHSATKLMSKIFNRDIIARDRNRFHHFRHGSCSCKDCW